MMQHNTAPADFTAVMTGTAQMMIDAVAGAIEGGKAIGHDVATVLAAWHGRALQRRHLADMDDRLLTDIGVDRVRALEEASKPFWQR